MTRPAKRGQEVYKQPKLPAIVLPQFPKGKDAYTSDDLKNAKCHIDSHSNKKVHYQSA